MNNCNKILEFNKVCKSYKQGDFVVNVLNGLNLSVNSGEMIAITGASGSGKSTILYIASLLEKIDSGVFQIGDFSQKKLTSPSAKNSIRLNYIGYIAQHCNLLKNFTAEENVMIPLLIKGYSKAKALIKAKSSLEELNILDKASRYVGELSGGEQQRVAIARALITKPKLILADEPTGSLDPDTADYIFNIFLSQIKKYNVSVIMVTHNLEIAKRMDVIYKLSHGVLTK